MFKRNNKPIIFILCLALLGFAFLSVGGEYLHGMIHNHEQGTEQHCPFYHFLIQASLALIVFLTALVLESQSNFVTTYRAFVSKTWACFSYLRAPPAAH